MTPQTGDRVLTEFGTGNVCRFQGDDGFVVRVDSGRELYYGSRGPFRVIERAHSRYTVSVGGKRASYVVPGFVSPHYSEMVAGRKGKR